MTVLLEITNATKRYGAQVILDETSVTFHENQKIGFIGRNGAGKSTLCRMILGQEELDSGNINFHPRMQLGYLQQHDPFEPGETVLDFLLRDSGEPDWKCGEVAGEFEIKGEILYRQVKELSGGWQTRVKLASLLLHEPNFLILDEPTNFLDLRTQILLQHFLQSYRGACLVVSHDRGFLKATCQQTLELHRGKLSFYPGSVEEFFRNKEEQRVHIERSNAAIESKRKQLEIFIDKNKARASTATQAKSKAKMLEKLVTTEIESDDKVITLRLPKVEPRQGPAFTTDELSIGYPDKVIASRINVEIEHQSRIALVGDNGQGKTTFLKTISKSLETKAGAYRWGYGCEIGVYAQHVYTTLPDHWTIKQYLESSAAPNVTTQQVVDLAGSFLFSGPLIEKPIKVLSGGERARLCMCGLLLSGCNVLILDEPGNHLDVETVEALAQAFLNYQGTIIFSSHDRYFMEKVTTHVIEVRDGKVASYPADYPTYVYRVTKEVEDNLRVTENERKDQKKSKGDKKEGAGVAFQANVPAHFPKRKNKEKPAILADIEQEIAALNQKKDEINDQFVEYANDLDKVQELHDELMQTFEQIGVLEEEWMFYSES
jgi:ATP-binding cassette subfamily F protein 3